MYGLKTLFGTTALVVGMALAPAAHAQIVVDIGVQPVCSYGYYDYAPYACAPYGFYGPGYFYNGIFLGMGPWAGWGYGHGWGEHRFTEERGGSYHGSGGAMANRSSFARGGMPDRSQARPAGRSGDAQMHGNSPASHAGGARPQATHSAPAHATAAHAAPRASAPHSSASRASAPHSSSGGGHASGGGGHEGGGHK